MGKITVKHYLNKKIKPQIRDDKTYYSVYIRIIYNKMIYQIKSKFAQFLEIHKGFYNDVYFVENNSFLTEEEFNKYDKYRIVMEYESSLIYKIIDYQLKIKNQNVFSDLSRIYFAYSRNVTAIVDYIVLNEFLNDLYKFGSIDLKNPVTKEIYPSGEVYEILQFINLYKFVEYGLNYESLKRVLPQFYKMEKYFEFQTVDYIDANRLFNKYIDTLIYTLMNDREINHNTKYLSIIEWILEGKQKFKDILIQNKEDNTRAVDIIDNILISNIGDNYLKSNYIEREYCR